MSAEALPWDEALLPSEERPQWRADIAALRAFHDQEGLLALKMGDQFNALKARWGKKMPALAREAGVPYHLARQRALVAGRFPADSQFRTMGLPFSILRLLAPLPEARPWAEKARTLQIARKLKVREFARMLEAAGLRQPRPRKAPRCLHCRQEIGETAGRLYFRRDETSGWLCNRTCALTYLTALCASEPAPDPEYNKDVQDRQDEGPAAAPSPSSCSSCPSLFNSDSEDSESQFRHRPDPVASAKRRPRAAAHRRLEIANNRLGSRRARPASRPRSSSQRPASPGQKRKSASRRSRAPPSARRRRSGAVRPPRR